MKQFVNFMQDECGQGLTEYGLILVLASIVAVALLRIFAGNVNVFFANETLQNALSSH